MAIVELSPDTNDSPNRVGIDVTSGDEAKFRTFREAARILDFAADELWGDWWGNDEPRLTVYMEIVDDTRPVKFSVDEPDYLEVELRVTPRSVSSEPFSTLLSTIDLGLSFAGERRGLGPPLACPRDRLESATEIVERFRDSLSDTAHVILESVHGEGGFDVDGDQFSLKDLRDFSEFDGDMFLEMVDALVRQGRLRIDLPEIALYREVMLVDPYEMAWTQTGPDIEPYVKQIGPARRTSEEMTVTSRPSNPPAHIQGDSSGTGVNEFESYLSDEDELAPFGTDEGADLLLEWLPRRAELCTFGISELLVRSGFDDALEAVVAWQPGSPDPEPIDEATIVQAGSFLLLSLCGHIDQEGHEAGLKALRILLATYPGDPSLERQFEDLLTWPG